MEKTKKAIIELRNYCELSTEWLADYLGIEEEVYKDCEKGAVIVSLNHLNDLAILYGQDPKDIMDNKLNKSVILKDFIKIINPKDKKSLSKSKEMLSNYRYLCTSLKLEKVENF